MSDITPADERRQVLEMLERGQISAAEADEVMAALEGRSAAEELRAQRPLRPSAERPPCLPDRRASVPALVAVVAGLAGAVARAIAGLCIALGRVVGAVARLSGRARRL